MSDPPQPPRMVPWLERLVPLELRRDPLTRRRAVLTVGFVIAADIAGLSLVPLLLSVDDPFLRVVGVSNTIVCLGLVSLALVFLRRRRSLALAGNWLTAWLYIGLAYAVVSGTGVRAPFAAALPVLPLLAGITAGRRSGVFWGVLSGATIVILCGLQLAGVELPDLTPPDSAVQLAGGALVATIGLVTWMTSFSETMKEDAIVQAERAARDLEIAIGEEEKARIAAAQAIAANAAKSAFLATMSHELRTPLNAIMGYSELALDILSDRGDAGDELADDMRKVHAAGRHLLGLITDVLDLSRIEAERLELSPSEFDPAELLDEIREVFSPLAQRSDDVLELDLAADLGPVFHDITRLRQVAINLVGNAIKFTRGGTITLRGRTGEDTFELVVEDTGIGIPEAKLDAIFEPFTQVDNSTTRRYEGTGLGLAVCRKLVGLMGGDIEVRSELGKGSRFTVRLPRRYRAPERRAGSGDSASLWR
jgi:signal transduction histidine kinase